MAKTTTTRYDVTEHLRPLRKWLPISKPVLKKLTDAAFVAKALGDIARARGMRRSPAMLVYPAKALQGAFR